VFRQLPVPFVFFIPALPLFLAFDLPFLRFQPDQQEAVRRCRSKVPLDDPSADSDRFRQVGSTVDAPNVHTAPAPPSACTTLCETPSETVRDSRDVHKAIIP